MPIAYDMGNLNSTVPFIWPRRFCLDNRRLSGRNKAVLFFSSPSGPRQITFSYLSGQMCLFFSFICLANSVSDPSHFDVDPDPVPDPGIHIWEKWMDPDPRIHISVIVDPDFHIFHIFHKEIHVGQITILIFVTAI